MNPATPFPERHRLVFSGRVQGVGFRQTSVTIAKRFPITGYVRNLSDGTVELIAEGTLEAVSGVEEGLKSFFGKNITGCSLQTSPATGEFSSFEIR